MPDAYTYISKPTGADYTNVNAQGREQYDQASLTYDDANTFYDGIYSNAYTNIAKPSDGLMGRAGMSQGLLIPLTRSTDYQSDGYIKIAKPTT